MAKILHRIFEIYESREEAIRTLAPKAERTARESSAPDLGTFGHLAVSRLAGVTRVEFREASNFNEATVAGLREDFAQLADKLGVGSKVLVDFTGVELFQAAFIDALLLFSKKLRTKGSRIALCCLAPTAREFFFSPDDRGSLGPRL
jgi:hypothetical protein